MKWSVFIAAIATLWASCACQAGELDAERQFWEENAFLCMAGDPPFPSKERLGDADACDDGDMTLFNGLLCASGEERGCEAVARAQGPDGRWWRSPRRIGWEAPQHDVSFSPDQSMGALLYILQRRDADRFSAWLAWIESNRACLFEIGGHCVQRSWPRFCRDDDDKRCTLRPADCLRLELVGRIVGRDGQVCRRVMAEFGLPDTLIMPLDKWILGSAIVNEPGYPMHLAAVNILLARKAGLNTPKISLAAETLALRAPDNPFFAFLASGKSDPVVSAVRASCPAPDRASTHRFQWTWERVAKPDAWLESMYWECISAENQPGY